jgi:hypothetical protein
MFEWPKREKAPTHALIADAFAPLLGQLQLDGTHMTATTAVMAKRLCNSVFISLGD